MHLQRRPNHRRPLLYPCQAVAVGVHGGGIEAHSVVSNHQINPVAIASALDCNKRLIPQVIESGYL